MTKECKRIGGQALIEGVLMVAPDKKAMAVRRADGQIVTEYLEQTPTSKAEQIPFIRGSVRLFKQLVLGTRAMSRSAELSEQTGEEGDNKKISDWVYILTTLLGIGVSVVLFMLLPNFLVTMACRLLELPVYRSGWQSWILTLCEGLIRILIFLLYLVLVSQLKEMKRVLQYHGAEHKTIACYESGQELFVENVRQHSRLHRRCGTAFLFLVMVVSVLVLSCFGWKVWYMNLFFRLLMLPVIAGISYEIISWAGRHDNRLSRMVSQPGLWLQKLTTAEPTDDMIEVAIASVEAVL